MTSLALLLIGFIASMVFVIYNLVSFDIKQRYECKEVGVEMSINFGRPNCGVHGFVRREVK